MKSFERWQEVKGILYAALEMAAAERSSFLDQKCGNDNELRREVESLLSAHSKAGERFDSPAVEKMAAVVSGDQADGMIGRSLGHYEIVDKIGAGGMGEVYLARDQRLDRKVAIKLLPSFFLQDPDRLRRFQQEARAASALNHPNILTIHEVGHLDSAHYIATEFVHGESLRDRIRHAPMKVTEALDIATQIASALATAHEAGIIHRDVKPENIMLRQDGIVKVVDFGLAKLTQRPSIESEDSTIVHTDEGIVMGTAQYMSPEQARGLRVDARSDIWSLGCVLYEMLAGRSPFEAPTAGDVIVSILEREPPPLSRFAPEIPSELKRIVTKALRKEKDERYQTGTELVADLRSLKKRLEFEAEVERTGSPEQRVTGVTARGSDQRRPVDTIRQPVEHPTSSAEYLVSGFRRHKGVSLLVLAVLLVSSVSAAFLLSGMKTRATINSIAVLPLRPLTPDENSRALGLGLTDTLIMKIGGLRQVTVRPISAVTPFADVPQDALEIGKKLNVDAVLEGTIQHLEGRVRFNVRLLRVQNGEQIWAEQFEGDSAQIFDLQDRLTSHTAEALKLKLGTSENEQIAKRFTNNADALDAYLKGRYFCNRRTVGDLRTAIGYFDQAIARDRNYALAYAGLADAYSLLADYDGALPGEAYPKARDAAMKALELDEELAEAHTSLAYVQMFYYHDWQGAQDGFRRAIALNPNYATARHWYSEFLTAMGRFDEASDEIRRAKVIDPLSASINAQEVWVLFYARRFDEAIERAQILAERNPDYAEIYDPLKRCYDQKQTYREAIAARQKRRKLAGWDSTDTTALKEAASTSDAAVYWKKRLEQEIEEARSELPMPFEMAVIYAQLGEKDLAFRWLDKAIENRTYPVVFLKVTPDIDPLRADPRFADALRRTGLLN